MQIGYSSKRLMLIADCLLRGAPSHGDPAEDQAEDQLHNHLVSLATEDQHNSSIYSS